MLEKPEVVGILKTKWLRTALQRMDFQEKCYWYSYLYTCMYFYYTILGYVLNYINFMYEENVVTYIIHALLLLMTKFCFNTGQTTICFNSV